MAIYDSENEDDICQVPVVNMQNEEVCCGMRFLHDESTGTWHFRILLDRNYIGLRLIV